jgi:hypothetical protein
MRIAPAIPLNPEQRTVLESQAPSRSLPVQVAERARICCSQCQQDKEIAASLAITPKKVWSQGSAHLVRPRIETASPGDLQDQQRFCLRGETGRHRRSVAQSARTRLAASVVQSSGKKG